MNFWIKTQDNGLSQIVDILPIDDNKIYGYSINRRLMLLGSYDTEKRALEVLDGIMKFLFISYNASNINYQTADLKIKSLAVSNMVKVFEMPEE